MIAIIDSCGSNIASLQYALQRIGVSAILTANKKIIQSASHVFLPGVGHAEFAMSQLRTLDLIDTILQLQQPVLGICLGMQLLYESSEEGDVQGLGIFPGKIRRMVVEKNFTVPHMGWNLLQPLPNHPNHSLLNKICNGDYFYYVHGYFAAIDETHTIARSSYCNDFAAIVGRNNFFGVQFHPEKSGMVGQQLLKNFIQMRL